MRVSGLGVSQLPGTPWPATRPSGGSSTTAIRGTVGRAE